MNDEPLEIEADQVEPIEPPDPARRTGNVTRPTMVVIIVFYVILLGMCFAALGIALVVFNRR